MAFLRCLNQNFLLLNYNSLLPFLNNEIYDFLQITKITSNLKDHNNYHLDFRVHFEDHYKVFCI